MIGVGILSVLAIALVVYFKMPEKTAELAEPPPPAIEPIKKKKKKICLSRYVVSL